MQHGLAARKGYIAWCVAGGPRTQIDTFYSANGRKVAINPGTIDRFWPILLKNSFPRRTRFFEKREKRRKSRVKHAVWRSVRNHGRSRRKQLSLFGSLEFQAF